MKERGILFSAPMVRALLAGTKTQTRRAVKPQPVGGDTIQRKGMDPGWIVGQLRDSENAWRDLRCPYGQPGDRLWVRETWMPDPRDDGTWGYTAWAGCREGRIAGVPERFRHPAFCNYAADWLHGTVVWTPGIHMPRWASRILLEVTAVRVERLQSITGNDVIAEGCEFPDGEGLSREQIGARWTPYRALWERINGPGSWDANPWVWVIEFRRIPLPAGVQPQGNEGMK